MPDLYVDLYFRGMVKFTADESDCSRFRGIDRVAHEYARRLPELCDLGKLVQFGSRLPVITKRSFKVAGVASGIDAPEKFSLREAFLVVLNRIDRLGERQASPIRKLARIACAAARKLGIAAVESQLYFPQSPRPGDLWLSFCSPFTPAIRRLPVKRVVLCHDLNQIFHYREMGLNAPDLVPASNHCLDVRSDEWVICISEYTRSCFLKFHSGFPPERAFVVPNGSDLATLPPTSSGDAVLENYGLVRQEYFITIAAGDLHKHSAHIIEEFLAWRAATPQGRTIKLVLVGTGKKQLMSRLPAGGQDAIDRGEILFTGFVTDAHLPALYEGSIAFLFASLAEGFGLPPLEAMQHGTPVICSDKTSLPEVVGDAGLLFDPLVSGELAGRLTEITGNEELRDKLVRLGKARAAEYVWDRSAEELVAVLKKISAWETAVVHSRTCELRE